MAGLLKITIIFSLFVNMILTKELGPRQIFESIFESHVGEIMDNSKEIPKTMGIVVPEDDGPKDPRSTRRKGKPDYWILEKYSGLGIPTLIFQGSQLEIPPRDVTRSGASVGLTTWLIPEGMENKTLFRQHLYNIDEMTSALSKNTILVLDNNGRVWNMIDKSAKGIDLKRNLNRKIIIVHSNK